MDDDTLRQFDDIMCQLRKKIYSVRMPEFVFFDIDPTLFPTYGCQEGGSFNGHYQTYGYHPLLCYDGLTGALIRAQLRDGTDYCPKARGHWKVENNLHWQLDFTFRDDKNSSMKKQAYNLKCYTYDKRGKTACSSHYILEMNLIQIVLDDLRRVTHFARMKERQFAEYINRKTARSCAVR